MDNKKIDPNVYENFVDASTALMLEFYSAHHQEPLSALPEADREFPAALDALCRKDIRTSFARHQRQKVLRSTMKVAAGVLCALLVTIGLASTLILSIDAIREPFFYYYMTQTDKYTQFSSPSQNVSIPSAPFHPEDPLHGALPSGYTLSFSEVYPTMVYTKYTHPDGKEIKLDFFVLENTTSKFDTENAQTVSLFIGTESHEALMIIKGNVITVVWAHEERNALCSIIATDLSDADVLLMAELLADRIDGSDFALGY